MAVAAAGSGREHPQAQQIEVTTAIALALQELHAVHIPFEYAVGIGQGERRLHHRPVGEQAVGKADEDSDAAAISPIITRTSRKGRACRQRPSRVSRFSSAMRLAGLRAGWDAIAPTSWLPPACSSLQRPRALPQGVAADLGSGCPWPQRRWQAEGTLRPCRDGCEGGSNGAYLGDRSAVMASLTLSIPQSAREPFLCRR